MQFRNLGRFRTGGTSNNMRLAIPAPKTPDGRVYRYSPNESAEPRHFVLGEADASFQPSDAAKRRMKLEPRSKQTVCPYSGMVAGDDDFTHPEDIKAARDIVAHAAIQDVEAELSRMFEGFSNRQSRNSLIRITAKVENKHRPKPRFSRRDLMRELVCDHCRRDYGVFAIGLFCPDCGAPNLRLHFAREIEIVGNQIDLAECLDASQEELAYRLLGNAHEDVLTAFEATLKTVYLYGMAQRLIDAAPFKPVRNDFQNIEKGISRFKELDIAPFESLGEREMEILALNIQKRHVIGHNLGIMDAQFARLAEDAKVGETVNLVGDDIRAFGAISQKVIDALDTWLGGAPSPHVNALPMLTIREADQVDDLSDDDTAKLRELDVRLSALARQIGLWLAQNDAAASRLMVGGDTLKGAFHGNTEAEIVEAIAELKIEGFVETTALMNGLPHVRATVDLYETFDPIAFGTNPHEDSLILIEKIIPDQQAGNAARLHEQSGFPLRQFNPALMLVLSHIDTRHISREISATYPASNFILNAENRVLLRRHLEKFRS